MANRSKRLIKKLHKHWLPMVLIDTSQSAHWRNKLFSSPPGQVFNIRSEAMDGMSAETVAAIRRFKLRFSVSVVAMHEAEPWVSVKDAVMFKFWATGSLGVREYSANNPAICRN
jgi:hypothetical protein